MNIEEGKERGVYSGNPHQPGYANYPPHEAVTRYPQPSAPQYSSASPPPPQSYAHGHQAGPGYPVYQGGQPVKGYDALPCCGIGIGWFLFILGFFLGVIPWYVGAIMLCCFHDKDKREKSGFLACAIIAVIATILIIVAVVVVNNNHTSSGYVDPYN